ncbi:MAG: 2-octaprenyl-6-methoxyphenol hydroxylase [Gammaproteobacteria bacterium]|jgi:2-octaprenyl-6-methoxyphenol hydroxylase|nr:2-octaprenyl-6-methoxyphenol hydroxylase [Gammaproteobacteria bacterium]
MTAQAMAPAFDIAIAGGGMVGASLAAALVPLGLKIALIEAVAHDSAAQPSFDERTTALSNGSRRILETLGVWPGVQSLATPIRKIHVSDQGRFGFARIDAAEQGLAAMGYVVPNRALGIALWSRLQASANVAVFCPAEVSRVTAGEHAVSLEVTQAGVPATLDTQLVVAADGVQSAVRSAFGVDAESRDYGQTAVITTVLPQRFHDGVAYERFTGNGPLALLPLEGGRCALVLTLSTAAAASAMAWSDPEFLAEVQRRFGFRLGRFLKVGRRSAYPLSLTRAERTSAGRCAIVGNAAQGLHPVAGMGFNLGLRDVASLAELIAERRHEPGFDAGAASLLAEYDAWRAADRGGVIAFTDGLVRMFANPLSVVQRLRNVGLLAFDLLPPAKAALSRLSTGAGGGARVPKLARGVALR